MAIIIKPFKVIKDGFFYARERDFKQGIDRNEKYSIEIVNR